MKARSLAAALAAVLLAAAGMARGEAPRPTRVLYLVPADKAPKREYTEAIARGVLALQAWYREQLNGPTFNVAPRVVELCRSPMPSSWFETNEAYLRVVDEIRACGFGGFDDPAARWIVYADLKSPCNATWRLGAGGNGLTIMPIQDLEGLAGAEQTIDACGTPWRTGIGRWIGGVGHELGHALGLPHPAECATGVGTCDANALMWAGYYIWPNTYLRADDKDALATGFRAQPFLGAASVALTSVSAASYTPGVAPGSLAAAFGAALATRTESARSAECVTTLADRGVFVRDAVGIEYAACVSFVGPTQINYRLPIAMNWLSRDATPVPIPPLVRVVNTVTGEDVSLGIATLQGVAPAFFSVGEGRAAGYVVRVRAGRQFIESLSGQIDLGPEGDQVYVVLYATGLRGDLTRGRVSVDFGGVAGRVDWSGDAPGYPGVEQVNVLVPRALAGRADVPVSMSASFDGVVSRTAGKPPVLSFR